MSKWHIKMISSVTEPVAQGNSVFAFGIWYNYKVCS